MRKIILTMKLTIQLGTTNGGQKITLTGSGFLDEKTSVKICTSPCSIVSVSAAEVVCVTPLQTCKERIVYQQSFKRIDLNFVCLF